MLPDGKWVYMMRERQAEAQRQLEQRCLIHQAFPNQKKHRKNLIRRIVHKFKSILLNLNNHFRRPMREPSMTSGQSIVDKAQS